MSNHRSVPTKHNNQVNKGCSYAAPITTGVMSLVIVIRTRIGQLIKMQFILCILFLSCVAYPKQLFAADTEVADLFGMVVSGKRPGPPLWKVSNEKNILWIFGTLDYLPKNLDWDESSVRFELSQAEAFISPPEFSARENNPFRAISLMRRINKAREIPDEKTLEEILPVELYSRLMALKSIYGPNGNDIFELRPDEAADELFREAREAVDLRFDQKVSSRLRRIARRNDAVLIDHVKSLDVNLTIEAFESTSLADGIACLDSTLRTIETDLEAMIIRANAWAVGNAELLLNLVYPDKSEFCGSAVFKSDEIGRIASETRSEWVDSIEYALSSYENSFANFPMREIVHPEGLLNHLRQKGYTVSGQQLSN
ncbi:MAG: hypothetical protein GKR91_04975 [Pseudomonadales bacterium]|nr:hypothetical protein [Pseudomonadales bacterium]